MISFTSAVGFLIFFFSMCYGACRLKITIKTSLTTHPSLNSCRATYSHCSIPSIIWFKFNSKCTAFLIVFIYKLHSAPSNRLLMEMCFFLLNERVHGNWFASMLFCYSLSISLSHSVLSYLNQCKCSCICLLLFFTMVIFWKGLCDQGWLINCFQG